MASEFPPTGSNIRQTGEVVEVCPPGQSTGQKYRTDPTTRELKPESDIPPGEPTATTATPPEGPLAL